MICGKSLLSASAAYLRRPLEDAGGDHLIQEICQGTAEVVSLKQRFHQAVHLPVLFFSILRLLGLLLNSAALHQNCLLL
jgi:hypothetical protein